MFCTDCCRINDASAERCVHCGADLKNRGRIIKETDDNTADLALYTYAFLIMLPLGALIGLVVPDNIMEYSWASKFTCFVASYIPVVQGIGRITAVPANQFIVASHIMLGLLFIPAFMVYSLKYNLEKTLNYCRRMSDMKKAGAFGCLPVFLYFSGIILLGPCEG